MVSDLKVKGLWISQTSGLTRKSFTSIRYYKSIPSSSKGSSEEVKVRTDPNYHLKISKTKTSFSLAKTSFTARHWIILLISGSTLNGSWTQWPYEWLKAASKWLPTKMAWYKNNSLTILNQWLLLARLLIISVIFQEWTLMQVRVASLLSMLKCCDKRALSTLKINHHTWCPMVTTRSYSTQWQSTLSDNRNLTGQVRAIVALTSTWAHSQ